MKKPFLSIALILFLAVFVFGQDAAPTPEPDSAKPLPPVSYGIVVDNSGSYRLILEKVIRLAKAVVGENKGDDETFLVSFVSTDKIRLRQDFTAVNADIDDALDALYIEGGQTAIVDALYFSAKHLAEKAKADPNRLRVLILVSDGDERQSVTKYDELMRFLKSEKISVFAVGLAEGGQVSTKILDKVTKDSGGKLYTPKTVAETSATVGSLSSAIRKK